MESVSQAPRGLDDLAHLRASWWWIPELGECRRRGRVSLQVLPRILWWLRSGDWRSPGAVRDAGRHTGTKRSPGAGFRLMRASESGRPDSDARIDPPDPFWRRTCGNPTPAPARPGQAPSPPTTTTSPQNSRMSLVT